MTWHTALSPEATKAAEQAAARRRVYAASRRCTLARTEIHAVILRPSTESRKHQREFVAWMAENLPQFQFNSKRNWWEAPLPELLPAAQALGDLTAITAGAQEYINE